MNSDIKIENGNIINSTEAIDLKEMEKDIIKLQYEKVSWISVLGLLSFIVVLFNVFVIGQLNSFRTELNSFRTELNSFRIELTHFETSINYRFDKLDSKLEQTILESNRKFDKFEQALLESNKRSDILFQELINLKIK
jgi:hypothetical protein